MLGWLLTKWRCERLLGSHAADLPPRDRHRRGTSLGAYGFQ